MAIFKSDAQGFLVGELVESNRDMLRSQSQGLSIWKAIRTDVKAIARAIGVQQATAKRLNQPSARGTVTRAPATQSAVAALRNSGVVTPVRRDSSGRYVAAPVAGRGLSSRAAQQSGTSAGRASISVPATVGRDQGGRFVAGMKRDGSGPITPRAGGGDVMPAGAITRLSDSISKMSSTVLQADNVDPTINAVKEVSDVVSPLGRGLFSVFGRSAQNKKERWYSRILKALTGKKPEAKTSAGGGWFGGGAAGAGGTGSSLLGTAGKTIAGVAGGGLLSRLFGGGKAAIGAGEAGAAGAGAGLLGGAGKLLKRVPVLGALLAAGTMASALFSGDDKDKTPEENRKTRYNNVGEAGGMLAGGVAGAKGGALLGGLLGSVVPVVGTAAGAAVGAFLGGVGGAIMGEKFGGKVGEWTQSLVDSDLPKQMAGAWGATTAGISAAWGSLATDAGKAWSDTMGVVGPAWSAFAADAKTAWGTMTDGVGSWWKDMKGGANALNDTIKGATGFDAKAAIVDAYGKTKDMAGAALSQAGSTLADVGAGMVPNTIKRAFNAGSAAATQAKAGYDVERGNGTAAPAANGGLQAGARAAGGAVGAGVNGVTGGKSAQRAFATGAAYSAGNIGGLDDANTRALVASTAMTESGGGNLGVVNSAGYMGRYQAGAGWLADAGKINGGSAATKAAMNADGYSNEYKWGLSGGMTKFLKNDKNWSGGMSYDKYLGSAAEQDSAFKTNSDSAYSQMMKRGTIDSGTSQERVAGLLKARHIAGMGGAIAVANGGTGAIDANGTSAKKYYDDLALNKEGFSSAYRGIAGVAAVPAMRPTVAANVPMSVPENIPKIPDTPTPSTPLNSGAGAGRGVNVSAPEQISQNVGDRATAHIVTGGIGSVR